MPDQYNLSGDFRGAILNIASTLENVQQTVGQMQTGDEDSRRELQQLIGQLSKELTAAVPAEKKEQVEAVAATAKALVEQAKEPKPNRTMLQITGEGLKQAAQNVADVLPTVLSIATQIVLAVGKMTR
ncbi:MAG TPA: hypothetical protein DEQ80_07760 [Anaerolinea thermolimosa]|uniref:DUF4404 family protein n=1 Tax=Anaerolinea thermolimosa TaxID=229919 RepID=A0A3D1JGP0_9CHLR|nr:hypothetical protein [Anaerolinea thermolimosa]GAP08463.1 hypothetical protein ATHL_03367 [Anaerolinea thermolimosa]HCE17739.1 hypothetical protein [Anaerolinea thermolimosa]